MNRPSSLEEREIALRSVLQGIALAPDEQIALVGAKGCVNCNVKMLFDRWAKEFSDKGWLAGLPAEHRAALKTVEQAADIIGGPCNEPELVRRGKDFAELRAAARDALHAFGWDAGSPDRQYVPGTEEYFHRREQAEKARKKAQSSSRRRDKAALRYHQQLFDALEVAPFISDENVNRLRRRERELGVALPAAVFELLSIQGIAELFREHTNEDELVTNDEFDEWVKLEQLGRPEEAAQGYLCVAVENQGVVRFYVSLRGGDDPPVFHDNDQWQEDLSKIDWIVCTDTFSEFVRRMMLRE